MKHRGWPLLAFAFGSLILLLGLSGTAMYRHVGYISREVARSQASFQESERGLHELRFHIYALAVLVRDYLLDTTPQEEAEERRQLLEIHVSILKEMEALRRSTGKDQAPALEQLRRGVDDYWQSIASILLWTPVQKAARGPAFLRRNVVPYRAIVLAIANQIGVLNASYLKQRQDLIMDAIDDFQRYLTRVLAAAMALGVLIAGLSIARTTVLENRAERHRLQIERDRQELRNLSLKIVKAQEDERKSISRELHDQVGQMLTALRMELGNVEQLRDSPGGQFPEHLGAAKTLAEQTLRVVRDMAMGLRPSVLDDLGLASALKWQAREFARRSGVPVDVQIEGSLERLPEAQRTCVYRIVQEALTNCARHAKASTIRVTCHGDERRVSVTVQDDGVGFDPGNQVGRGLGLLGIEERVRELGGEVSVFSQPRKGTLLRAEIPFAGEKRV